jgi:uncharacterized protein
MMRAFVILLLALTDVPFLTGRVVDNANILSATERTTLTATLRTYEERTTNQIVVLTVPTISPDSIEAYASDVFKAWKLGQKGKDNGILLVVVPQERRLRIEVGYGLEATLTDGAAGDIIRTWMTPAFKSGNYDKGVDDGVAAIIAHLDGRDMNDRAPVSAPAPSAITIRRGSFNTPDLPWPMRILMGAFIFGILGLFTVIGVMTPGMGWFLYLFLIPFWAMFPVIVIGPEANVVLLATYLIGYPVAKLRLKEQPWYRKMAADLKAKGTASIGGFTITSGGSGGFSSGGGGGFSGGGGSSGGGGASGSW